MFTNTATVTYKKQLNYLEIMYRPKLHT